jgi:hypothetical protein
MTDSERISAENGIWLCQNCGKLVDNDTVRYAAGVLEHWKSISESVALLHVEGQHDAATEPADVDLLRFFTQCLDRPAFQDLFHLEGSVEAFDRAIEDTIIAINTGSLRDRQGRVLAQAQGKAYLRRLEWRRQMDTIVDLLRAIRSRYEHALKKGEITVSAQDGGREFYVIHNRDMARWIDGTRAQVTNLFTEICKQAGLQGLHFPHPHSERW